MQPGQMSITSGSAGGALGSRGLPVAPSPSGATSTGASKSSCVVGDSSNGASPGVVGVGAGSVGALRVGRVGSGGAAGFPDVPLL